MYTGLRIACIVCAAALISAVAGQQTQSPWVLNIKEIDQDGGRFTLLKERSIVDISSEIQVKINKDLLRQRSGELDSTSSFQTLLTTAIELEKAARQGKQTIPGLTNALNAWVESDGRNLNELQRQLSQAARAAQQIIISAKMGTRLRDRLNQVLGEGGSIAAQYRGVFKVAADEADFLRDDIDEVLKTEGTYFQMGAWIVASKGSRPIHLPGFDEYPEGPRFEIKRWNLVPSQEQAKEFTALRGRVRELNRTGFTGIVDELKDSTPAVVLRIFTVVDSCTDALETSFKAILNSPQAELEEIKTEVRIVTGRLDEYKSFILLKKAKYEQAGELFANRDDAAEIVLADFEEIRARTNAMLDHLRGVKDFADRFVRENRTVALMVNFAESLESSSQAFQKSIANTAQSVRDVVSGLVALNRIETDLLQFSDKVLKLDITSLADSTRFSLDNAGVRDEGDVLVLKIAAGRGESELTRKELEVRQIHLYKVLLHTDVIVTPILALPAFTDEVDEDFQFAASSSLLFRWGSRNSVLTNRLFKPGLGFNFSVLDFNNNNTPEVGVGLVLSLLRDFAQLGGGYNVHEKVVFGFFGFRMPLASPIAVQ